MIDMNAVAWLDNLQIDHEADKLLAVFARECGLGEIVPPIPIDDIIERHLKVDFEVEDLSAFGEGVLGAAWFDGKGRIVVDPSLENDHHEGRMCFTMAHEVGHWKLHRPMYLFEQEQQPLFRTEVPGPAVVCRDVGRGGPRKPRGEYQADRFAGALLMPRRSIEATWRRVVGPDALSLDPAARHENFIGLTSDDIARTYGEEVRDAGNFSNVSVAAMAVRLKELGLLVVGPVATGQGVLNTK